MKFSVLIGLVALVHTGYGQIEDDAYGYFNDALLFSRTSPGYGSTARVQGFGGSQIALGGDMSSAGSNPAGLGFYNRSVFSFTPDLNFHTAETDYLNQSTSSYKNSFYFGNIGLVLNNSVGDIAKSKFKGGSFAISLHRINNFHNEIAYEGRNSNNSIVDAFIENSATIDPENLGEYEYSAYQNYLIDPEFDDQNVVQGYSSVVQGFPYQAETINRKGGQNQLNLSWGGNYNDRFYFGGGLGIQTINYSIRRNYSEREFLFVNTDGDLEQDNLINELTIVDDFRIDGTGINGTFGVIARPVSYVTIGIAYQTPTYYSLKEESGFTHRVNWNNLEIIDENDESEFINDISYTSEIIISNYNLKTPQRLSAGAALFLGKSGFVTGDIEYVDYTGAQLKSSKFSMAADNETIKNLYKSVINYRLGVEGRIDIFRIRGGYAYYPDPLDSDGNNESISNITFGVGLRQKDYFVDLAVVNSSFKSLESPYSISVDQPVAGISNSTTTLGVTVGFNF